MPRVGSSPSFMSGEAIYSAPCRRPETTSCSCVDTQRGGSRGGCQPVLSARTPRSCVLCPYCTLTHAHSGSARSHRHTNTCRRKHLQRHTMTDIQAHKHTDTLIDPHGGWDPVPHRQTYLCRLIPANTGPHRFTNANACPHVRTDTRSHPRAYSLSDMVSEHPNVLTHLQTHIGPGTQHTKTGHAPTDSS